MRLSEWPASVYVEGQPLHQQLVSGLLQVACTTKADGMQSLQQGWKHHQRQLWCRAEVVLYLISSTRSANSMGKPHHVKHGQAMRIQGVQTGTSTQCLGASMLSCLLPAW